MKKIKWFICVVLVAMLTSILSGCAAVIPIPEIKEGRFDFSVTCEVNGEEKTSVYIECYNNPEKDTFSEEDSMLYYYMMDGVNEIARSISETAGYATH